MWRLTKRNWKGAMASSRDLSPGSWPSRQSVMKSFLSACGVADSLRLIIESPGAQEAELRLLQQPFAVIGRDLRTDVVLNHDQVSRRHVYLQVVEGRAFWVDLESRTGSRSGSGVQKCGWLVGGRTL